MFENIISNYKILKNPKIKTVSNIDIIGVLLSNHNENNLEIIIAFSSKKPNSSSLRSIWKDRKGGTATPLLVICSYNEKVSICGPLGDEPPVYEGITKNICEVIIRESLEKLDDSLSLRTIKDMFLSLEQNTSGIKNEGLFSNYVLSDGAKRRSDWNKVKIKSQQVLGKTDTDLLSALGYEYETLDSLAYVLKAAGKKKALGILLKPDEMIETQNKRFGNVSPVTHAFNLADRENLPFVIICTGQSIRIYSTDIDMGVGRKGRTETYVHCQTNLLTDKDISLLWLIYSSNALNKNGSFYGLLEDSKIFAGNLAKNLRERIYNHVVPLLALGISDGQKNKKPTIDDLKKIYNLTMLVLFRILFIAYAEDKDLLPYKSNDLYKKKSLKSIALEIKEIKILNQNNFSDDSSYWDNLKHIFYAINNGNKQWGVPIYNGGLFSIDKDLSPLGQVLDNIKIKDKYMAEALYYLLLIEDNDLVSTIDFRSLGVREFGTIYEGLLDGAISYADENYEITKNNILKVSSKKDPDIKKGSIYLHNKSGERKSSGSYYTKSFIVNDLVKKALEPKLDKHFQNLNNMSDEEAGELFFDFKIADIAMGSGHFLITAIDVAEIKFSNYLSSRDIPKITNELKELRLSALNNLGELSNNVEIEDSQLLRRLIARRCIYGVDQNEVAVQLARLAIWIHTFVPGLPLSFLDHNLVVGNSLIGIGTLNEIEDKFYENENSMPLLFSDPTVLIKNSIEPLKKLASLADSTIADIKKANQANKEALNSIKPASILCDIITAARIEKEPIEIDLQKLNEDLNSLFGSKLFKRYEKILKSIDQFHFPIAFPEVFLRNHSGFDVILGNPPWEEATIEENAFWARYFPGLRGLDQRNQEREKKDLKERWPNLFKEFENTTESLKTIRKALVSGDFPGMGKGDPDFYKAFCWRFWNLINKDGVLGIVLPKNAFVAKGSEEFRKTLISNSKEIDLTFLINKNKWIFSEVHGQYLISLAVIKKNKIKKDTDIFLKGPIDSYEIFTKEKINSSKFVGIDILNWNESASFPTLPTPYSFNVFSKITSHPKINNTNQEWEVRPNTELHATNDKKFIDLLSKSCPKNFWPVFKGESFAEGENDTGIYYGWSDPLITKKMLFESRRRSYQRKGSVFSNFKKDYIENINTLECNHERIVFRDVTNSIDRRTIIATIVPKNIFLTNKAPYLLFSKGNIKQQTYLLGMLNSTPLDWFARRYVGLNINFFIFNSFPVPKFKDNKIVEKFIELTVRINCQNKKLQNWSKKLNIEVKTYDSKKIENFIAELDAIACFLYKLNLEDIDHIYKTYRTGWQYEEKLNKVKNYFNKL